MIQLVLYHHNCLLTNLQHAKQTARAYTRFRAYTLFRAKQAALAAIQLDVFEDVRS
jgi:hypothetical protein